MSAWWEVNRALFLCGNVCVYGGRCLHGGRLTYIDMTQSAGSNLMDTLIAMNSLCIPLRTCYMISIMVFIIIE